MGCLRADHVDMIIKDFSYFYFILHHFSTSLKRCCCVFEVHWNPIKMNIVCWRLTAQGLGRVYFSGWTGQTRNSKNFRELRRGKVEVSLEFWSSQNCEWIWRPRDWSEIPGSHVAHAKSDRFPADARAICVTSTRNLSRLSLLRAFLLVSLSSSLTALSCCCFSSYLLRAPFAHLGRDGIAGEEKKTEIQNIFRIFSINIALHLNGWPAPPVVDQVEKNQEKLNPIARISWSDLKIFFFWNLLRISSTLSRDLMMSEVNAWDFIRFIFCVVCRKFP